MAGNSDHGLRYISSQSTAQILILRQQIIILPHQAFGQGVSHFLGFPYGAAAAAIGSALADVFSGYLIYAPGTFIIKGTMAAIAYLILRVCRKRSFPVTVSSVLGGIAAEAIMIGGYFVYDGLILGVGLAAAASVPGNIVQGIAGCVISAVLYSVLAKKKKGIS